MSYRFDTIAEMDAYITEHYPDGGGFYGIGRWGVGCCREWHEQYNKLCDESRQKSQASQNSLPVELQNPS